MSIETRLFTYERFHVPVHAKIATREDTPFLEITAESKSTRGLVSKAVHGKINSQYWACITPNGCLRLAENEINMKPFALLERGDKVLSSCDQYPLGYRLDHDETQEGLVEIEIFQNADRVGYFVVQIDQ